MSGLGSSAPRRAAALVLFAVVVTGVLVLLARADWPGHFSILRLHVWAGWALLLLGGPALAQHLGATSSLRWTLGAATLLALAGSLALLAATGPGSPEGTGPVEHLISAWRGHRMGMRVPRVVWLPPAAFAAIAVPTLALIGVALASRAEQSRAARWWGLSLTALCAWAAVSGAGLPLVPRDHLFTGMAVHSAVGVLAVAVLLLHSVAVRAPRRGLSRGAVAALCAGVLVVVGGGALGLDRVEHLFPTMNKEWGAGMARARTPRTADERAAFVDPAGQWPTWDPSVRRDSLSCGAAGCHPDITAEWAGSPHRFAASNAFYRAATSDLVARGDLAGAVFCANCHDPERVLTGTLADAYRDGVPEAGSDGVSCLVCHAMVRVDSEPPGNGLFTASTAPPHTADVQRFREDVALDPRRHSEVLGVDLFMLSPMPCKSCHRIELGRDHGVLADGGVVIQNQALPESAPGVEASTCEECHLPRIQREFDQYPHRMPGINVDQAAYVTPSEGDADLIAAHSLAAAEQAGLSPRVAIDAEEWPTAPPPPTFVTQNGGGRILSLRVRWARTAEQLRLDVTTRNARVGHDFPSGPLDLQQIWLEVRVADASGRVLHHVGDLDADGAIVGDPPRLGGRELDAAGEDIRRHRLFDIAEVRKRVLALGAGAEDQLFIDLPADVAWPLDVRARWLFRRANPTFARWALGGDEDGAGSPLPAHELVTFQGDVPAPE